MSTPSPAASTIVVVTPGAMALEVSAPASVGSDPAAATSPVSVTESSPPSTDGRSPTAPSQKEIELQRKRARDRKSQQAMRDRTKWTIANLGEQVTVLSQMLDERTRDVSLANAHIHILEADNAQLRTHNAALQLSLMGSEPRLDLADLSTSAAAAAAAAVASLASGASGLAPPEMPKVPWEIPPAEGPPTCLSDQILQGFIVAKVQQQKLLVQSDLDAPAIVFNSKPNLCALLEKDRRTADAISDVVGDIVRSYLEIDTLPKQVAVFYIMCSLLKWMILLDRPSWDAMPTWLRPTSAQVSTPHAAWIDRIPWPHARDYLIAHPEITLDHFAAVYSTSFSIRWPYDPCHVLIHGSAADEDTTINPVYEEHIRQLANWEVGHAFRDRYPAMGELIDGDAGILEL